MVAVAAGVATAEDPVVEVTAGTTAEVTAEVTAEAMVIKEMLH